MVVIKLKNNDDVSYNISQIGKIKKGKELHYDTLVSMWL